MIGQQNTKSRKTWTVSRSASQQQAATARSFPIFHLSIPILLSKEVSQEPNYHQEFPHLRELAHRHTNIYFCRPNLVGQIQQQIIQMLRGFDVKEDMKRDAKMQKQKRNWKALERRRRERGEGRKEEREEKAWNTLSCLAGALIWARRAEKTLVEEKWSFLD